MKLTNALSIQNIMGVDSMQLVAWYVPMGLGGCFLAVIGGYVLHMISGTLILILTGAAIIVASLLLALAPQHASYWAWILPAMICATVSIDLVFNMANVFLSTALPARQQGLAGALGNVLFQLSISILLGVAGVVVRYTSHQGQGESYKNAFWFQFACGAAMLVVSMGFVSIGKAQSDLTVDEKKQQTSRK